MANTAILVGNSRYSLLSELACCADDILATKELLEATGKYADIEVIENADADNLKSRIRAAIDRTLPIGELLFYFTGHGFQLETEFYYCSTNFDSERPNKTGLSHSELHTLLRLADAELVVKIIDACNSGTLLVKADGGFASQQKHGFKNLIQISSCLESQNSLTGHPLSMFTEKFRAAALSKAEGTVYYTDIMYTLRDAFLDNENQTPFFVAQGTGREQFAEDAKCFDALRARLAASAISSMPADEQPAIPAVPTLRERLHSADANMATSPQVTAFIGTFFDKLLKQISADEFAEFFEQAITEHSHFTEPTARAFLIRVLSTESRPDNFVTAKIKRERRQPRWTDVAGAAFLGAFGGDQAYSEAYELELNCLLQRAQIKVTLTPKFLSLKRLVLVVTCAPSLETCYVFEIVTQHSLEDFDKFDINGDEVARRWWRLRWGDSTDGIVSQIVKKLNEVVRAHLDTTERRLGADKA